MITILAILISTINTSQHNNYGIFAQNNPSSPTIPPSSNNIPSPIPNPNSNIVCSNYPQIQSHGKYLHYVQLIVIKQVVGGTDPPSAFTISVQGSHPSPTTFQGSGKTPVVLGQGYYVVREIGGTQDYNAEYSSGCEGSISGGQTITCIITNRPAVDNQPPKVLSFTAQPFRVSFSSGGTITITAHVTDATGVQRVEVVIQDECSGSPGFFHSMELPRVSGTATDGIYQSTFTITESALDVNHFCNQFLAFQIGGVATDTLGIGRGFTPNWSDIRSLTFSFPFLFSIKKF